MKLNVAELIEQHAENAPERPALVYKGSVESYGALWQSLSRLSQAFAGSGLARRDRVAIYLEKRPEMVTAAFAAAHAGGAFVPINPVAKPAQVAYILENCTASVLVTSAARYGALRDDLRACDSLKQVVLVDGPVEAVRDATPVVIGWDDYLAGAGTAASAAPQSIDTDMAAILYTSGSTGRPKGVVLSHRNLIVGGQSVSSYIGNTADDRILAALPFSFDAGLSQLTTAFCVGATVVLHNYLLPGEVPRICAKEGVTGLTGVPPLYMQLMRQSWPDEARQSLRYFANTGGHMPRALLDQLRETFPNAKPFLMYGLTEAFRSTYLDPAEVERRPDSIGKAIPNAEILVARQDGSLCEPGEEGELVHRGALVSLGYWNDPETTALRFRPAPGQPDGIPNKELAVWSGDIVKRDEEGFLYFVGRSDDMIKTSGYRVSPTEIEELAYARDDVAEAAAIGAPHAELGQAIVLLVAPKAGQDFDEESLLADYKKALPAYMVPRSILLRESLPRSGNGKIDRRSLAEACADLYREGEAA